MKKKTYIKQGAFQKVENTQGKDIKGALNLNKEVLDTLVDKDVIGTTDCCSYFPVVPTLAVNDWSDPTPSETLIVPDGGLFKTVSPIDSTVFRFYLKVGGTINLIALD